MSREKYWGLMAWLYCTPEELAERRAECESFNPHRGPQGPNEDIGQCSYCGMPNRTLRAAGETFGEHLPDCSLPIDHESYCVPGGSGHPTARLVRG